MEKLAILWVFLLVGPNVAKLDAPKYGSYSSGVKTKTKTKTSGPPSHPGIQFRGGCSSPPPTPQNAGIRCSQYSGCKADCRPSYQFPNGATQLFIVCENGQWVIEGGIWRDLPSCEPVCLPPCQNRGICTAPNQCQCPENYEGPFCEYENKPCMTYPQLTTNARRTCSSKSCTITCLDGHQFPDGSSIATISCKDGFWVPDKEKWTALPDCEAVCDPPCSNGGNCLSFGVCQCPQDFRGPQCQYSVSNCNSRKLQFNGGYNCSGDHTALRCSLSCPEGMKFDTPPAPLYTCLYQEGRFTPTPSPRCVLSDPQFGRYSYSRHSNRNSSNSVFNLDTLTVNGFPDVSYVPAGHRWDNYDNKYTDADSIHFVTVNPYESNRIEVLQKLPEPGVCFTWQGTHYKTFDGKVYSFDSKCAHVLVRDAVDNTFSVTVQNDPKCSANPTGCSRIITVFFDEKEYVLKRSSEGIPVFATRKKRLPIPAQLPGVRVEMSADFIVMHLDSVGSKMRWDGQQLLQIEVQESLWNRTEGLCGNIDGDRSNDLRGKNGHTSESVSNVASTWKVEDLEGSCDDLPREGHACQVQSSRAADAEAFCGKLINDQRFAACHVVVDTSVVLDTCKWDYCSCENPNPSTCACESMNVYVRSCTFKGVKSLAAWRDEETCPKQCTGGRVYRPCGPPSGQPVCGASTELTDEDETQCVEGCYCPEGTVLHDDRCITRDECPCKLRTKSFPPGAQVPKECNTCTCNGGKWVCTQTSCGSRCAAVGDPHYTTFDGKRYDFMGQCSYYLVKTASFSIEAENVACAGSISEAMSFPVAVSSGLPSCTKTVTVKIFGQVIKLKQGHNVVVNGEDVTKLPYQLGNVTIRAVSSIFVQVELPNGMLVWWDGVTRAYIDIPAEFGEKTRGLCGTFNNNQKDDFVTPEEDVEQAVIPFANKWKTSEKCSDIPDILKLHPCSADVQKQPTAERHCQKLKSDLFSSCHWIVNPEPYYQDCLYDMCSCEFKISKCLCPNFAAYATECSRQGVKVPWREAIGECGVHCPAGQKYQVCGNSCTRTCFDVAARPDCKPQCVEGCNCPEGEALDEGGQCVPIGECKCQYDGLQFHPGYKEVRPATKGPELCTCINAAWSCRPATKEEESKHPKASDLKSLCSFSDNMEFTTCEPAEPVTCKNMHDLEYFSAAVCHPGCKCKEGYVLDSTTTKCVRPSECPCHHGGKSYKENATVQNDCNTCKCQNGKWTCTDRQCAAECSAWGDSHFKTFDGKHYDFQGQCDYVLAKGNLGSSSFDISIQNVPCGTLGTSCSKSISLRIKSGQDQDTLFLSRDKSLPDFTSMKHTIVRQKGLLGIVEAPDLGLVVLWDKGTRVYVRVDPRWKEKMNGLCGNYNDNDADDFQTPSGGITEVSPLIFGDSWKLQPYCPETSEVTSTCQDRPDRKVWALKQCGILKSSVFAPCHSEVPVDIYLEKCVFDACACDQGGDCECLCTALAAYAQECTNRGVPIKWRSQELCPMQCDERCANYSPCVSTCPAETCDSLLTESPVTKTCKESPCIEGCAPKPCPPDQIYLNSSFLECIPRNVCKPTCLEVDGVTYFEGELVEGDECYSCYCSRGEKICTGQPCSTQVSTTPSYVTHQLEEILKCESGWSEWINSDKTKTPSKKQFLKKKSDYEPIPSLLILNDQNGGKCSTDKMADIECRTVKTHLTPKETGLDVECTLERGLICTSHGHRSSCPDFEIRVFCKCDEKSTCDPLKPHKEHPSNCHLFYQCEEGLNGPNYIEKTCGSTMYYNPVTMTCDWPYAVEEIKPECKKVLTSTEVAAETVMTSQTEVEEELIEAEVAEAAENTKSKKKRKCPSGTTINECGIQCDRICLYYLYVLQARGLCQNGRKCEPDCAEHSCPKGQFAASNDTCVPLQDCLCRSNDGRPIKPGNVYKESDCRVCQCVDNYYSCDESACKEAEKQQGASVAREESEHVEIVGTLQLTTPGTLTEAATQSGVLPPILSPVTPPPQCEGFTELIRGKHGVVLNATTFLSPEFKPENAKFNSSGGGWVPQYSNKMQYLEIDLGQQEPVYGVQIQGSSLYDEYVTSYKVSYSPDGSGQFLPVLNKEKLPQVFRGSIDAHTPVEQMFKPPFEAQIVRIHPETWHGGISLKVELLGCETPHEPTTLTTGTTPEPLMCDDPMGLENAMMSDQQISVSSELNRDSSKSNLKLSSENAWQPVVNSPTEFVQFDFLEPRNITGIETKGGPEGWVTAYLVKYSQDDKDWSPVVDKKTRNEKVFLGNFDSDSSQINRFELPINAKLIKLIPTKWSRNIQMRVEPHGCFEPYPAVEGETTTVVPSTCNYCPQVTSAPLELDACRCETNKWWDGETCVDRTECPCFVGHISYPVGTSYQKEDCSECLCKIGGVSYCNPKKCDKCESGLRSTVTSTCKCTCQPCPDNTTLCPTSNICINSTLWCNGIEDCPDDEATCVTTAGTGGTPSLATTPATVRPKKEEECRVVECPKGYKRQAKKPTKGRRYQASMFSTSYPRKTFKTTIPGVKTFRKTPMRKPATTSAPLAQEPSICQEYVCVSARPAPGYVHSKQECPPASCPPGYLPVFDKEDYLHNKCPEYECEPTPVPDAVCNVTGRTFSTFDGTEYKYDVCSHVLARSLEDDWQISLKKVCNETCRRDLVILHEDHIIVFHPNLTLEFDGFQYNVQQTKQIGSAMKAFSVSRLGNALLFVSNRYGFWIIWDDEGNLKLGVTRKLIDQVDGLCGFFNENPNDDKRRPDGSPARTTVEFGDSWADAGKENLCEPQVCPLHLQNKAWEICQIKQQSLDVCRGLVDIDAFVSRCTETTCDCLQAAAKNRTAEDVCRCSALEDFVVECLTAEPSTEISDWRLQVDCPVACDAALVHYDCYQRKCEPTCESLLSSEASCPKLAHVCLPGCYCPPGTVKKGDACITPSNCRDCECNVLPQLEYVTYDNTNFSINANCVYVMSRDVPEDGGEHKFQVLVTNAPCKNNEKKTCVGKVTILYGGRKIHVLNDLLRKKLKVIVDGERIDDLGEITWAKVRETTSKHVTLKLTDIQVDISVYFPSLGVSVKAPSHKYGGQLEGLCGDCDNNPLNDLRTPDRQIINNTDEFALSWLYDKPSMRQSREQCENKPEDCPPLPKESDPCNIILDYKTFGQCLRLLDPTLFLDWCRKDTCDDHPELACTAIEAYAKDCASAGFCINWRTNICSPKTCPPDQIYNPCGSSCPKTCESIKEKEKSCLDIPVEGCFCPEGKILRNNTCVIPKDCEVCDEEGHHPGDTWKKDKCTTCTCEGTSLKCDTEHCSGSDKICEQGHRAVKIASKEDECCDKYACVPEPTSGPTCETPQPITCASDQVMKLSAKPSGCQSFICECRPPEECEPLNATETSLEEGYVNIKDESGCCPRIKTLCKSELCPPPKPCEQYHILKNETVAGKCCPLYTCQPPEDSCIYEYEYAADESGGERPRSRVERQKVLKDANETWQDGPCRQCKCSLTSIGNYQAFCSQTDCSPVEIFPDFLDYKLVEEPVYDRCCPKAKRVACKFEERVYEVGQNWTKDNDFCTIYECVNTTNEVQKEKRVIECDTSCDLGFEYINASPESKQCCGSCRPHACVVEGKVYKAGAQWASPDFCIKYSCLNINGTLQVQSDKVSCPELPKDYLDDFVIETAEVEGECCKKHEATACKVNDEVYKVGETWPSPDGDKCKTVTCLRNQKGDLVKQESVQTCKTNCSKGFEYQQSSATCCGDCVRVACVVNEQLRRPDETWTSPDNCTIYTCEHFGDEFLVSSQQESCPSLENCPEGDVYVKGCCKHCNITSAPQKRCAAEDIPLNKTIGLIKATRGEHGACANTEPVGAFTECVGICHSATFFNADKGSHESDCSCCQATKYIPLQVELQCEDGYKFKKSIAVPSRCSCEGCAAPTKGTKKASLVKT